MREKTTVRVKKVVMRVRQGNRKRKIGREACPPEEVGRVLPWHHLGALLPFGLRQGKRYRGYVLLPIVAFWPLLHVRQRWRLHATSRDCWLRGKVHYAQLFVFRVSCALLIAAPNIYLLPKSRVVEWGIFAMRAPSDKMRRRRLRVEMNS